MVFQNSFVILFLTLIITVVSFTNSERLTFPPSKNQGQFIRPEQQPRPLQQRLPVRAEVSTPQPTHPSSPQENRNPIYDFATNLYLNIKAKKGTGENVLVSPFSIRIISALIYLASRGQTSDEIRQGLQFPESHDDLVEGLMKHLASTQFVQMSKFDVGNAIFMREGTLLNQTYTNILQSKLRSHIAKTRFTNQVQASEQINSWVANVTRNRITKLVDPSSLSASTSIFLASALYFSGQWMNPFDETTTSSDVFQLENGKTVNVPMMQTEAKFSYNYIDELQSTGISLPFKDSRFEFIILKPNDGVSLDQLEFFLSQYQLNRLSKKIKKENRNVFLQLPKFRLDVHYDLVDVLKSLGIKSLFNPNKADLTGLSKSGGQNSVSQLIHQTALDINENGAAAAAVSVVSIYPISSPSHFRLDKPFIFLLNDRLTGPVFLGRLANPLAPTKITI